MKIAIKLCDAYRDKERGWHASSRIRGHWLAKYWDECDDIFYPEYFKQEYHAFFETKNQLKLLKDYDVVIFHKTYEWELAKELKLRGKMVIIDLSDPDYLLGFSNVNRAGLCLLTIANSNGVVVNNKLMIDDLKIYDGFVSYIPDRIDMEDSQFTRPEKIVWFGHSDNYGSITPYIEELSENYQVITISDKPCGLSNLVEFVEYHPNTINQEIKKADAVFLGKKLNKYKSPNRYLTAVSLGMPVLTIEALRNFDIRQSVEEYKQVICELASTAKKK